MSIIQANLIQRVGPIVFNFANKAVVRTGGTLAGANMRRNGSWDPSQFGGGGGAPYPSEWLSSGATPTVGDAYQVSALLVSGTNASNIDGLWRQLNTDVQFLLNGNGSFTIFIQPFGGGATLASATVTVT